MQNILSQTLVYEEKRATKWFLWLFYTVYFGYGVIYNFILPQTPWSMNSSPIGLDFNNILISIVMLGLLPLAVYLMKTQRPTLIKYIYFITFTLLNTINDIWLYWGSETAFSSGNIVEVVIVLFAPLFINKRFFFIVFFGTAFKFILLGLVLQDLFVVVPLFMVIVIAMIASLLLYRFLRYVNAIEQSYNRQLEGIVKGVIATLELKDPYTRGHSERVAHYAVSLAKATGHYDTDQLNNFYYTCLLHDIGKIHISDSILTKPQKLTDEEYAIVKQHPVVGAEAVRDVEGIANYIDIIYYHHERWDGNGYPDELQGKETPYAARITAIADAFDAMTTSRSYRKALPVEVAYKRIVEAKGTQFDPELVDRFIEIYPEWKDYHDQANVDELSEGG